MGRRGPPPQPTSLRHLRGNPGKRRIDGREPQPKLEAPTCPQWLSAKAKRVWRDLVPVLKGMRILTRVDRDALTVYCQTYARWRGAEEFIDQHGEIYPVRDAQGNVTRMKLYPQVGVASTLLQVVRSYQQEFGMTPSARTRVQEIPDTTMDSDAARWFGPRPISIPPPLPKGRKNPR